MSCVVANLLCWGMGFKYNCYGVEIYVVLYTKSVVDFFSILDVLQKFTGFNSEDKPTIGVKKIPNSTLNTHSSQFFSSKF